jgi:hypothetical protein
MNTARSLKNRIHANRPAPQQRSAGGSTRDVLFAVRELTGKAAPNDQIAALRATAEEAKDADALAGALAAAEATVTVTRGKRAKKDDDDEKDEDERDEDDDDDDGDELSSPRVKEPDEDAKASLRHLLGTGRKAKPADPAALFASTASADPPGLTRNRALDGTVQKFRTNLDGVERYRR